MNEVTDFATDVEFDMEIAAETELDSNSIISTVELPASSTDAIANEIDAVKEVNSSCSTPASIDTDISNMESNEADDSNNPETGIAATVGDASKPLKSILKKRKPERFPDDPDNKVDTVEQPDKIPKGGSIAQALKLLTKYTNESDDDGDTDPKPSAFVLEMERQKAISAIDPGMMNLPAGYGVTESSTKDHYFNPFGIHKDKIDDEKNTQMVDATPNKNVVQPTKAKQKSGKRDYTSAIEAVLLINNLPFKITRNEIMAIIGICPKGGKDGVRIITDRSALPTGYAYVIVERYYDMMDLLRLSGFEYQGRRLRVSKSKRENLMDDWRISKIALTELDKSRVICVKHVPFVLEKSGLASALREVKINDKDIYWSPLRKNQTNSGRAFVILRSSEDAKAVHNRSFPCMGRRINAVQVHPDDMKKFLEQCKMELEPGIRVFDDLPDGIDDISDLNLDMERPESPCPMTIEVARRQKSKNTSRASDRKSNNRDSSQENWNRMPHPNFAPTVFIRLFNVPEKATTADIKTFFEPVLPAKITQNIGSNVWDVEFFNPNDGVQAMSRNNLMMRKNVIRLQMLRAPPQTPQPNHFPGPFPPQILPPGLPMMVPHPGMMQPGMDGPHPGFPGMMGPRIPPPGPGPMFHPGIRPDGLPMDYPMNIQHSMSSHPESGRWAPYNSHVDPRSMPAPMNDSRSSRNEDRDQRGSANRKREARKSPSPEQAPLPKRELIPVPPIPDDFTKYVIPPFDGKTPVGQAIITSMQGYFCQLCNKFYSTKASAKDTHCKTKGHYDKLKQVLQEKKRLRKLAEAEHVGKG